ncbi:hypothetical protein [Streptomyces sp. NPDC005799]|uniref:hypothetical protein n=1 Tax=Streptomyces sp. NPDC005799 TaxID=3154678 RepID=UPI0033E9F79B
MGAQPSTGGDELRARAFLRRLHVRPFGHQDPAVSTPDNQPQPITPTRVIPAGAPLPARPPRPDEAPPWRTPPPPPVTVPPPPPAPVEVRHIHEVVLVAPEPTAEEPPRLWERLWDALITWRLLVAVLAALLPWAYGRSPVGVWGHTVHQARTEAGIGAAYVIAGVAATAAWGLDRHSGGRLIPRFLLVTALIGGLGVLDWFDSITFLTGVTR